MWVENGYRRPEVTIVRTQEFDSTAACSCHCWNTEGFIFETSCQNLSHIVVIIVDIIVIIVGLLYLSWNINYAAIPMILDSRLIVKNM